MTESSTRWFVRKSSRPHSGPYAGPPCEQAGVEPGATYETYEEALDVAAALSRHNPVGFVVEPRFAQMTPIEALKVVEEASSEVRAGGCRLYTDGVACHVCERGVARYQSALAILRDALTPTTLTISYGGAGTAPELPPPLAEYRDSDGNLYEPTGEWRPARRGEWFAARDGDHSIESGRALPGPIGPLRRILRPVTPKVTLIGTEEERRLWRGAVYRVLWAMRTAKCGASLNAAAHLRHADEMVPFDWQPPGLSDIPGARELWEMLGGETP